MASSQGKNSRRAGAQRSREHSSQGAPLGILSVKQTRVLKERRILSGPQTATPPSDFIPFSSPQGDDSSQAGFTAQQPFGRKGAEQQQEKRPVIPEGGLAALIQRFGTSPEGFG